jgi:NADP-dependent 3-hydroxy acid dehydrogenase YdfG
VGRFAGKLVVITGAGRGLGAALAISLAELEARLVLCGRNEQALADIASIIVERTGNAPTCIAVDLADVGSVTEASRAILASNPTVDVLVNNGAMWLEGRKEPYTADEVAGVVNAAITGTFLFTQALLPGLERSESPDIVTIGSISGLLNASLHTVSVPFYAAKHGQSAIAEGLKQMLVGSPVRSITIHPPYLDDILPTDPEWEEVAHRAKGGRGTNRDVVEAVIFALTRPRHVTLSMVLDTDNGGQYAAP